MLMDLIRIGLRAGEFNSCLRKGQLTDLTKRQSCNADHASTKGKTAISEILYVALAQKKCFDSFIGNTPGFTDLHFDFLCQSRFSSQSMHIAALTTSFFLEMESVNAV